VWGGDLAATLNVALKIARFWQLVLEKNDLLYGHAAAATPRGGGKYADSPGRDQGQGQGQGQGKGGIQGGGGFQGGCESVAPTATHRDLDRDLDLDSNTDSGLGLKLGLGTGRSLTTRGLDAADDPAGTHDAEDATDLLEIGTLQRGLFAHAAGEAGRARSGSLQQALDHAAALLSQEWRSATQHAADELRGRMLRFVQPHSESVSAFKGHVLSAADKTRQASAIAASLRFALGQAQGQSQDKLDAFCGTSTGVRPNGGGTKGWEGWTDWADWENWACTPQDPFVDATAQLERQFERMCDPNWRARLPEEVLRAAGAGTETGTCGVGPEVEAGAVARAKERDGEGPRPWEGSDAHPRTGQGSKTECARTAAPSTSTSNGLGALPVPAVLLRQLYLAEFALPLLQT
jgi:hypothetical protein